MYDLVKQDGINQDAPGFGGKYQLKNSEYGSSNGDRIDNSQSANPVVASTLSIQGQKNAQGTGTTFFYPTGKSAAQVY